MPNHVIISTLGWSRRPVEEAFAGIAALEFGQVDLAVHEGWAHIMPSALVAAGPTGVRAEAERLHRAAEAAGLRRISALNVGLRGANLVEEQRRLEAVCALAAALEIEVITIGAARRGTPMEEETQRLAALVPIARERNVILTVETHTNQLTEHPDLAVQLCQAVPALGLTLDASHYYAGPNQGKDFSTVFPYVRHVHLRDAGGDWEHVQVPAGEGLVPFGEIVGSLHALGYDGKFAIEYIDSMALVTGPRGSGGDPGDIPANIIAMRNIFLAAERGAGIVRTPSAPAA